MFGGDRYIHNGKIAGFYLSTIFCFVNLLIFPFAISVPLMYLETDPKSIELAGPLPTQLWKLAQMAFVTALFLDFISWLFTVDKEKARLYFFVLVIQGMPVVSYGLMGYGYAPILVDVHGRRFLVLRYVSIDFHMYFFGI